MILGYNTNGFANHDGLDALRVLSDIGYQSVGLTIDHHCLNPFDSGINVKLLETKKFLDDHGLRNVIETGARFLLDPQQKH